MMAQKFALVGPDKRILQISDKKFDVSPLLKWVPCLDSQQIGDHWTGSAFVPYDRLTEEKTRRLNELNEFRKSKEKGGIIYKGFLVDTDDNSQMKTKTTYDLFKDGMISTIDWGGKLENTWYTFDAASFMDMSLKMMSFVQQCFGVQKAHGQAIQAMTTIEDIGNYSFTDGWPSNEFG